MNEEKKRKTIIVIIIAVVFFISFAFSMSSITGNVISEGESLLPVNLIALAFFLCGLAGLFFVLRNK